MSLDIRIKVDAGNSVAAVNQVTTALEKVETQGEEAAKATKEVTGGLKQASAQAQQSAGSFEATARALHRVGESFRGIAEEAKRQRLAAVESTRIHAQLTSTAHAASLAFGNLAQAIQQQQAAAERAHTVHRQLTSTAHAAGQAFGKLAEVIAREQAALQRSSVVHQQLTSTAHAAGQAFGAMAQAIQREQQMLENIHGPMRRYTEDMRTLDALLARNKISTSDYAAQVARLNGELGKSKGAPQGAAAPGANMMGGLRSAAAAIGVTVGVSQIGQMANEFQNLQNRLRYLAGGDMQKVNAMFGELQGVASRTRADLSSTTEAFVRMSLATKSMGLSTGETLQLTESLNKAISLSGATGAEAAAGMIQLSQGLASGALRGDELRSVMEQLPAVADVIASSLGVSRGELRKMGEDGKITADVIVKAFKKAGATLDKDFGNTVPTVSQSITAFKNELMVTVGELNSSMHITEAFGDALSSLGTVVKVLAETLGTMAVALDAIGISGSSATKVIGAFGIAAYALGGPAGVIAALAVSAKLGADALGDLQHQANDARLAEEQLALSMPALQDAMSSITSSTDEWGNAVENLEDKLNKAKLSAVEFRRLFMSGGARAPFIGGDAIDMFQGIVGGDEDAVDEFNRIMRARSQAFDKAGAKASELIADRRKLVTAAREELDGLERLWVSYDHGGYTLDLYREKKAQLLAVINGTTSSAHRAREELEKLDRYVSLTRKTPSVAEMTNAGHWQDSGKAGSIAETTGDDAVDRALEVQRVNDEINQMVTDRVRQVGEEQKGLLDDLAQKNTEAAQRSAEAWAQGLGGIAANFANMAREGEISLDQIMGQLAKLALQMAAMQMGGPGGAFLSAFAGGLGGFGAGGSFRVGPGPGVELPRAATGADWAVGGAGGTDSKVAMFRVTPGETVHVRTPRQQQDDRRASGGGARPRVQVNLTDTRGMVIDTLGSYEGERAFARIERKSRRRY